MTAPHATTDLLAYNLNLETPSFLSQFAAPPDISVGKSFLHELAREGDTLSAEVVIGLGAKADLQDDEGRRPLHEAAFFGHEEMTALLLDSGAAIDAPILPFGHTALWLAVERGQAGVVRLLLKRGARLDVEDRLSGHGLLHLAAAQGNIPMAGLLISAGIDVFREDRKGQTARDYAARHRHREMEKTLLKIMEHHARVLHV